VRQNEGIGTILGLLGAAVLILVTGLFVAAEYSFVTVDRNRVERLAADGHRGATRLRRVLQRLSVTLSGTQLAVTVASLVLGFIAEPTVAAALEPAVGRGPSIGIGLVLVTVLSMLVGELIPKNVSIARADRIATRLAGPILVYTRLFGPLIRLLNRSANATVRRLGIEPQEELGSVRSLEELALIIRSSGEGGTLDPEALTLLTRTLRFNDKTAADALVPRLSVVTVGATETIPALVARSVETGFSRFPVIGVDLDDVTGIVHVKDVFRLPVGERATATVATIATEPFVVPESRDLGSLLTELRTGSHFALVVDEYGGIAGIITMEDVLEELVGEIDDEHDRGAPSLRAVLPTGQWELPGGLHPDEVADLTGFEIPDGPYETLAGFVLDRLDRIPSVGDRFVQDGWTFEVVAMDRRRIETVRVTAPPRRPAGDRGARPVEEPVA
jgi:CBS domain containing-hemolysin-like protein